MILCPEEGMNTLQDLIIKTGEKYADL